MNTAKYSQHISNAHRSQRSTQPPCPLPTPAASSSPFPANAPTSTPHSSLLRVMQPMRPSNMASGTLPPHQDHPDCNRPRSQRHIRLTGHAPLLLKKFLARFQNSLPTPSEPLTLHHLEPVLPKQPHSFRPDLNKKCPPDCTANGRHHCIHLPYDSCRELRRHWKTELSRLLPTSSVHRQLPLSVHLRR